MRFLLISDLIFNSSITKGNRFKTSPHSTNVCSQIAQKIFQDFLDAVTIHGFGYKKNARLGKILGRIQSSLSISEMTELVLNEVFVRQYFHHLHVYYLSTPESWKLKMSFPF